MIRRVLLHIRFLLSLTALILSNPSAAQPKPEVFTSWDQLKNEVPAWLQDAKFGIYFHWGVYTVPAYNSEWYSRSMYMPGTGPNKHQLSTYGSLKNFGYKDFIPLFRAEQFNAKEWADLFVLAGAKFAGPVAEHADGFSMWDSRVNPWNAKNMGPHRDIVGELAKAIRRKHLKFIATFHHQWRWGWYPTLDTSVDAGDPKYAGLYGPRVSEAAWQQKDSAERPDAAFSRDWLAKIKEVVHQYHPDILYFDSRLGHIGEDYRKEMVTDFFQSKHRYPPVVLYKGYDLPADVGMRMYEKSRMNRISEKPWLTEEPVSTYSWSYTTDMELRSAGDILNGLIDIVSKNGVYLLNISPAADGSIPQNQKDILLAIGKWLRRNGEAVYGTRPWYTYGEGPRKQADDKKETTNNRSEYAKLKFTADDIRYTRKGNKVYAIFLGKPKKGSRLVLKAFAANSDSKKISVKKVSMPGAKTKIKWEQLNEGLVIEAPSGGMENKPMVFRIETKTE